MRSLQAFAELGRLCGQIIDDEFYVMSCVLSQLLVLVGVCAQPADISKSEKIELEVQSEEATRAACLHLPGIGQSAYSDANMLFPMSSTIFVSSATPVAKFTSSQATTDITLVFRPPWGCEPVSVEVCCDNDKWAKRHQLARSSSGQYEISITVATDKLLQFKVREQILSDPMFHSLDCSSLLTGCGKPGTSMRK
eukprot:c16464_g1_i2.p1 GENE.c16464_g1_i2~~c16464_g1_i2.p1  ORF type:complete len:195 (-),score=27.49 c16464_g1_i2:268-852(-)